MFQDRSDAGRKLARALKKYSGKHVQVLAIPRGGVAVGYEVAMALNADFSLLIARKLPFPDNPEAGFGAVAEDGSVFIIREANPYLPAELTAQIIQQQKQEIIRRVAVLRHGQPLPRINQRTVILVDDGLAMGSTMRAAIMLCRNLKAKKVIVAVPVAGKDTAREVGALADEIFILEKPRFFQAVAQGYKDWYDVPDAEVIRIMNNWRNPHNKKTAAKTER